MSGGEELREVAVNDLSQGSPFALWDCQREQLDRWLDGGWEWPGWEHRDRWTNVRRPPVPPLAVTAIRSNYMAITREHVPWWRRLSAPWWRGRWWRARQWASDRLAIAADKIEP